MYFKSLLMRSDLIAELVPVCLHQINLLFQNLKAFLNLATVMEVVIPTFQSFELPPEILILPKLLSRK